MNIGKRKLANRLLLTRLAGRKLDHLAAANLCALEHLDPDRLGREILVDH
jgi:hypothetical protein